MKNWRTWLEIAIAATALLFILLWIHDRVETKTIADKISAKTTLQHPGLKPVASYTDTAGNKHSQYDAGANKVPQSALKDPAVTKGTFVDSAAKAMKIKDDQITELTRENLTLKAQLQLKPASDSANNHVFTYSDPHLNLSFNNITNRAALQYNVNITTGKFTPARWLLFGHTSPLLDLSTDDPRATINNVEHMSVTIPQPWFGYSLQAAGSYLMDTKQIVPALKFDLRFGRVHAGYEGYYIGTLRQAATVGYDLFRKN